MRAAGLTLPSFAAFFACFASCLSLERRSVTLADSKVSNSGELRPEARDDQEQAVSDGDLSVIHVVYATTSDGFPGLLHSMLSVARNLPANESCAIHVIVTKAELEHASEVLDCFQREVSGLPSAPVASLHTMPPLPWDTSKMRTSKEGLARSWGHQEKLSQPTVFARFYIADLFPHLSRALWLDVDTIVCTNVGPLYRWEMSHPLAARRSKTRKQTVKEVFPGWGCAKNLDQSYKFNSFNTGVLVMHLNRLRAGNFTPQLERAAAECVTNDQPATNMVFMNNINVLEPIWNSLSLGSTVKARTKRVANILHWSGPVKPWSEPEKCKQREVRASSLDCLSAENRADFEAYAPKQKCKALPDY